MTDSMKSHAYSLSILFTAMMVRGLLGLSRPDMGLTGSIVIGVTSVMLLAPILYRFVYQETLLTTRDAQVKYACLAAIAVGSFSYFILYPQG